MACLGLFATLPIWAIPCSQPPHWLSYWQVLMPYGCRVVPWGYVWMGDKPRVPWVYSSVLPIIIIIIKLNFAKLTLFGQCINKQQSQLKLFHPESGITSTQRFLRSLSFFSCFLYYCTTLKLQPTRNTINFRISG